MEGPNYHIYIPSTGKYPLSLSYKHASGVVFRVAPTVPICSLLKQGFSKYDRVRDISWRSRVGFITPEENKAAVMPGEASYWARYCAGSQLERLKWAFLVLINPQERSNSWSKCEKNKFFLSFEHPDITLNAPRPSPTTLAITLWGQQRKHHNFSYRSSDTRWAIALTDPDACETEARRHTDQPSELSWIYYRDKLLLLSPVSAATIPRVSEDLERDFIILVIIGAAFSWPCSALGRGGGGVRSLGVHNKSQICHYHYRQMKPRDFDFPANELNKILCCSISSSVWTWS